MPRLGCRFEAIVIVVIVGVLVLFSLPGAAFLEQITGETPQAKIASYVRAISRGDEKAALAVWKLPTWELYGGYSEKLRGRRQVVTHELIAAGIRPEFNILGIEWWSMCCEPHVTNDPRYAGGARVTVQFMDRSGSYLTCVFDVFTRGGSCWDETTACSPRRWALRDVYALGQEPFFWRAVYKCEVRDGARWCDIHWLDSPTSQ